MKKRTTTLISKLLMVIILFAISPACTDNYDEGMQLTEEDLYAYLYISNFYGQAKGGDGSINVNYEGSRFSLTDVPEWITMDDYNFESGKGTHVWGQEIKFHVKPNWTGSSREAKIAITAYSSDGISRSDEETITQQSYTYNDLSAYIRCTSSTKFSNGDSGDGILHITYRGGSFEISGVPDWMTIQSYDFKECTDYGWSDDLVIHADANYTGSTRRATITLISYLGDGRNQSYTVYITQNSK